MSKYIKEFKEIGESVVNIDLICKDWNDRFFISTWINDDEEKYMFLVNGKRKNTRLCKTVISRGQALTIANRLCLIHVKSPLVNSGGSFHTQSFIESEIKRIEVILNERKIETLILEKALYRFESSI